MLNELYVRGSERIHREFSVERLLINMREIRLFMKDGGYLTKEVRLRLQYTPSVIVDLNKDNDDSDEED